MRMPRPLHKPHSPRTVTLARSARTTAAAASLLVCASLYAADWPQYRGPNSDGSTTESILESWPANGPAQVWKVPMSDGFSSFAIGGNRAFTLTKKPIDGVDQEACVALDANTGKEIWSHPFATAKYDGGGDTGGPGDGPRGTPSVDNGNVYVLTSQLVLACLNGKDGRKVWSLDLLKEHAGRNIRWQNAASPLIDGGLIFVAGGGPGQSLLGVDKSSGKPVWKSEDELMTHATPVAATIHGQRQIIFITQSGLVSVQPNDGKVLWRQAFPHRTSTAASPVVAGDIVYCSAGYQQGSGAYKITKAGDTFQSTEIWMVRGDSICNHWSTPLHYKGHLYGLFGFKEFGKAPLKCIDLATGAVKWSESGFGPGNLILADDTLLVLGDQGQLVLVEPTPDAYKEKARATPLTGKCWSTPAVSGGRIYARSAKEAVCLDVSVKQAGTDR